VVQDIFLTQTAELAHVVLPASSSWCEAEGTVTNSERRVQRLRKALEPPGNARDDTWIIAEIAKRLGHDWGHPTAEEIWNEVRSLAPIFAGMSYDRLEHEGGLPLALLRRESSGRAVPSQPALAGTGRWTAGAILGGRT
jgi:formate dehydrogenase major subunit